MLSVVLDMPFGSRSRIQGQCLVHGAGRPTGNTPALESQEIAALDFDIRT